eukprot:CAMPEP_0201515412 /NCGR_PEP_ID=MMETSP0161_2-20130828/6987_1 /ASSEMBLY_ACC=CAM_ASM_000251 /TAXON_ID=180227 /ORGANISM="Neoparamoeba aestuarina, Strain SoJaBio B1-5/56/2" /LENGTH=168 /DNA_ID=CAMNT_0047912225 /DNA_START=32 /DNA_END=538 /DNA_ORIENTATION=-
MKPFEIQKYMSQWYQIGEARLPRQTFERNLYCTGAYYTFVESDGVVLVNNTGHTGVADGVFSEAHGKAAQTDPNNNPGALAVTFYGPIPTSPNYFVLDTDYDTYTLIGGPCKLYLWILSRTPQMDDATYNMLVEKAQNTFGYDLDRIFISVTVRTVPHEPLLQHLVGR